MNLPENKINMDEVCPSTNESNKHFEIPLDRALFAVDYFLLVFIRKVVNEDVIQRKNCLSFLIGSLNHSVLEKNNLILPMSGHINMCLPFILFACFMKEDNVDCKN